MHREKHLQKIGDSFKSHSIVALLGPRQCGKTTLAKMYIKKLTQVTYFDLEDPRDLLSLENPLLALEDLKGYIVIDEIQRRPDLFPVLRVLVDKNKNQKYLILGSASRELIKQSSETLAGRIAYLELTPFSLSETKNLKKLWIRGGFPKSYLARNIASSAGMAQTLYNNIFRTRHTKSWYSCSTTNTAPFLGNVSSLSWKYF